LVVRGIWQLSPDFKLVGSTALRTQLMDPTILAVPVPFVFGVETGATGGLRQGQDALERPASLTAP